jgi:putative peptide zinc metalloprotease protein
MVGVLLIGRQWDSFISTFPEVVTGSGIVMMAAILVVSKVFHELGHAITAAHYGCRVSTIGIAFFFGWPVLYTDVTDAWKLSRRGPLLAIAGAGMLTEIAIGSLALFAWSFLPDGGLQTVVFVMATTSWILTLVVNFNPLMRFDGYFLLADLVGVDNLQDRTFRFAQWNVRRLLFGTRDEPTERWRGLAAVGAVSYAVSVWVFRAILFGGLSLVVYTFAFKALGIVLFALCLYMFIGRPIVGACLEAWERREDMNGFHTVISVSILGGLIGLAFVPMAPDIDLPAVAKPAIQQTVFAPASGRIASVEIREGEQIEAGDPMLTFIAPDAEFDRDQATQALKALNLQRDNEQLDDERRGRSAILDEQIALSRERIRIADRQLQALTITAPISGRAEAVVSGLAAGVWIAKDQPITTLADSTSGYKITAYLDERDRAHLAQGATGHFIPDDLSAARYLVRLIDIETGAVQSLSEASLASTFGGPIAVWRAEDGSLKPDIGQFRTIWRPEGGEETRLSEAPMMTGTIRIAGSRETFADRFLRRVRAVTRREFGL